MEKNNMKNMVVLKNLPSNIVEEAIVILKPNIKLKNLDFIDTKSKNKTQDNNNEKSKKYIINEAEMIVSNYLSKIDTKNKNKMYIDKKMESKYKKIKAVSIFLGIMLMISFCI